MEELMRNIFSLALSPFACDSLIVEIPAVFSFIVGLFGLFFGFSRGN